MKDRITLSAFHVRLLHKILGLPVPPECADATGRPCAAIAEFLARVAHTSGQEWAAALEKQLGYGPNDSGGGVDLTREEIHALFKRSAALHARGRRKGNRSRSGR